MKGKRMSILRAAIGFFAQQGFHDTSTAQIARRADIGTGTLFRYFATKELLIHAVYSEVVYNLPSATLPAGVIPHVCTGNSIRDKLLHIWMSTAQRAVAYPDALTYWAMYRTSPYGKRLQMEEGHKLAPFNLVPILVNEASLAAGYTINNGALAGALFVGQWQAAVQYIHQFPEAAKHDPTILETSFQVWWRGVGL
jgi:hypothetical protein